MSLILQVLYKPFRYGKFDNVVYNFTGVQTYQYQDQGSDIKRDQHAKRGLIYWFVMVIIVPMPRLRLKKAWPNAAASVPAWKLSKFGIRRNSNPAYELGMVMPRAITTISSTSRIGMRILLQRSMPSPTPLKTM